MIPILIGIIVLSAGLFFLSFFLPDKTKELKNELDQLSLKFYQENYQLKKRLKVLEEELLISQPPQKMKAENHNPIIIQQVKLLNEEGLPIPQIAKQAALTEEDVYSILAKEDGGKTTWIEN